MSSAYRPHARHAQRHHEVRSAGAGACMGMAYRRVA